MGLRFLGSEVSVRISFGIGKHFASFHVGGKVLQKLSLEKSWVAGVGPLCLWRLSFYLVCCLYLLRR